MFMVADAPPMLDASASLPADPPAIVEPASAKPAELPAAAEPTPVIPPGYILVPASQVKPPPTPQIVVPAQPSRAVQPAQVAPALAGAEKVNDAIGVGVSWISGSGLIYRHYFANDFGFQVAGIPWVTGETSLFNVGGQVMQRIMYKEPVSLHWLAGFGFAYHRNNLFTSWKDTQRTDLGVAPGVGIDYALGKNWWLTGALSYTFGAQSATNEDGTIAVQAKGLSTGINGWYWDFTPGFGVGALFAW